MKKTTSVHMKQPFLWVSLAALVALSACTSGPRPADWQLDAKSALERSVSAYLQGNSGLEAQEFARARTAIASTGRLDLLAKVELLHCASHVASLVLTPCDGFEKIRLEAQPEERAYADYLAGRLNPQDASLLPPEQRAVATSLIGSNDVEIAAIKDPLSQLVAVAVVFQAGQSSPAQISLAVNAASSQGWRRPLLAWLGVELALAQKSGDVAKAASLERRMALVQADAFK